MDNPNQAQDAFWNEFVQLKADVSYVRAYRDELGRYVTGVATVRAIASSASIGAWVIWKQYAFLWATLIALAQVSDALKNVFPFAKRRAALSRWVRKLDLLFVASQKDWDDIAAGILTEEQIRKIVHRLRMTKLNAEAKYIPDGLSRREDLFRSAEMEAIRFFQVKYGLIIEEERPNELTKG